MEQNADHKHVSSDQDQNSMLKVICNQRDRFRARLRETEEVSFFTCFNHHLLIDCLTGLAFYIYNMEQLCIICKSVTIIQQVYKMLLDVLKNILEHF